MDEEADYLNEVAAICRQAAETVKTQDGKDLLLKAAALAEAEARETAARRAIPGTSVNDHG